MWWVCFLNDFSYIHLKLNTNVERLKGFHCLHQFRFAMHFLKVILRVSRNDLHLGSREQTVNIDKK